MAEQPNSFCRETTRFSVVDFDLDVDLDVVRNLAGVKTVGQMKHVHAFVLLKAVHVHVDVQEEASGFRLTHQVFDRNQIDKSAGGSFAM